MFREELLSDFLNVNIDENEERFSICRKILNYYAPCKEKYVPGNHLPFINKTLFKEIMKRNRLGKKFLKDRNDYNQRGFSKQRNYCEFLVIKSKKL